MKIILCLRFLSQIWNFSNDSWGWKAIRECQYKQSVTINWLIMAFLLHVHTHAWRSKENKCFFVFFCIFIPEDNCHFLKNFLKEEMDYFLIQFKWYILVWIHEYKLQTFIINLPDLFLMYFFIVSFNVEHP